MHQERGHLQIRKSSHQKPNTVGLGPQSWTFQAPVLWENKFSLFKPCGPCYFSIIAAEQNNRLVKDSCDYGSPSELKLSLVLSLVPAAGHSYLLLGLNFSLPPLKTDHPRAPSWIFWLLLSIHYSIHSWTLLYIRNTEKLVKRQVPVLQTQRSSFRKSGGRPLVLIVVIQKALTPHFEKYHSLSNFR